MNCRTCEYPLWDLKTRACPECNAPFLPSQYTFRRNSVAFCCPRCDQHYFGTGEGGRLEPRSFTCGGCGELLDEDSMVLRPGPGVDEDRTHYRPVPWLDPGMRSPVLRFIKTGVWSVFMPSQLGARLSLPDRPWAALKYLAAVSVMLALPGIVTAVIMMLLMPRGAGLLGMAPLGIVAVITAVWAPVFLVAWAAVTHVVLWATGATRAGFARTFSCMAYASACCAPAALPCAVGFYFIPLAMVPWTIFSALILRAGQRVSGVRAFVAAGLLPVIVWTLLGLFIALVVVPGVNSAMTMAAKMSAPTTPSQQAATVSSAIFTYAQANAGTGPAHMSELFLRGAVRAPDLLSGQVYRNDARVSIGRTNMLAIESLLAGPGSSVGSPTTDEVRADVKAMQPAGPITAHRVGDVVFTYHGMNLNAPADAGLWIFVITVEPSPFDAMGGGVAVSTPGTRQNPPPRPPLAIAKADGTVIEVADANFAAYLAAQNTLRIANGLDPIPDPRHIAANGFTTPADAPAPRDQPR